MSQNKTSVPANELMASAIYEGSVRHRRYSPKSHEFSYQVFMAYIDLSEIDQVFSQTPLWSHSSWALASFHRKDFFDGDTSTSLYEAVANKVESELGRRPTGPIRMLTNLRYFGYIINPITCYYCFDESGKNLEAVVAEVTNTPWKQRCHYVLDFYNDADIDKKSAVFDKTMHVSPFQPMGLVYTWKGKKPEKDLLVHLDVHRKETAINEANGNQVGSLELDATLVLKRLPMNSSNMNSILWRYPWMTVKVFLAIYWQAVKLFVKRMPFYSNLPENGKRIKCEN